LFGDEWNERVATLPGKAALSFTEGFELSLTEEKTNGLDDPDT